MTPQNRNKLANRIATAAEASLAAQGYVSAIDVLVGIEWLTPDSLKRWRQGQVDYLERVVHSNLSRISEAMKLFRAWAAQRGLLARETQYVTHTRHRQPLRFSRSGVDAIERLYRTHWVSPALVAKQRERRAALAGNPPPPPPAGG